MFQLNSSQEGKNFAVSFRKIFTKIDFPVHYSFYFIIRCLKSFKVRKFQQQNSLEQVKMFSVPLLINLLEKYNQTFLLRQFFYITFFRLLLEHFNIDFFLNFKTFLNLFVSARNL